MWLDDIISPLGRRTRSGLVVGCLFVDGASDMRKWLDVPESRIAQLSRFLSLIDIVGRAKAADTTYRLFVLCVCTGL